MGSTGPPHPAPPHPCPGPPLAVSEGGTGRGRGEGGSGGWVVVLRLLPSHIHPPHDGVAPRQYYMPGPLARVRHHGGVSVPRLVID